MCEKVYTVSYFSIPLKPPIRSAKTACRVTVPAFYPRSLSLVVKKDNPCG